MIVLDAMTTLFGTKQQDNQSLQDYTKRFEMYWNLNLEAQLPLLSMLKKNPTMIQ
jgi:hypothetical protein